MQANMGMAGEFRCVVKRADGSTKIDTGYQKNLILNQGLDFFGGGNGSNMMEYCVIGGGNSQPRYTQNTLDIAIAGSRGAKFSDKYDYDASRDGNLYKVNKVYKYYFRDLNNINISEVGLASTYTNNSNYYLCTRALIKDVSGNSTTITVLSGEVLEIYYKLWAVYDTTSTTGQFNLLDGVGGSVAYNYTVDAGLFGDISYSNFVGASYSEEARRSLRNDNWEYLYDGSSGVSHSKYIMGSYKRILTLGVDVSQANGRIRIFNSDNMGKWQIRFGSVADDSPIIKTSTQSLTLPIEFSWGRYEGAL